MEKIADLAAKLADGHPAVRGGWVTVPPRFVPKLGITAPAWEGEIREITREPSGRIVLTVYDPAHGYERLIDAPSAKSRKPPGAETRKRAAASIDGHERRAARAKGRRKPRKP